MKQIIIVIAVFSIAFGLLVVIVQEVSEYVEDDGLFGVGNNNNNTTHASGLYISRNQGNDFGNTLHFRDDNIENEEPKRIFQNDVVDIVHYLDSHGNLILLAATSSGIFVSVDQGLEWAEIFKDQIRGRVYDITLHDDGHEISLLVAGTGTNGRGTLYFSEAGGNKFTASYVAASADDPIVSVEFDIRNRNKAFAVTKQGLFLTSYDQGQTWSSRRMTTGAISVKAMKIYPYAALSGRSVLFVIAEDGLYKSSDNGTVWEYITSHHLRYEGSSTIHSMAFANRDIYLATDYGLLVSQDQGYSFHEFPFVLPHGTAAATAVATHPNDYNKLYVGIGENLYVTENAGESWRGRSVNSSLQDMDFIFINPLNYYIILVGF